MSRSDDQALIRTVPDGRGLEAAARLLTLADPDGVDADDLHEELASLRPGKILRLAVAHADEAVVAVSCVRRYPSEPAGLFHVSVAVARGARRRGVGTRVLDEALDFARAEGATRVLSQTLDADPAGPAFAERHSFAPVGHAFLLRADLTSSSHEPDGERERELARGGIRVTSFAAEHESDGAADRLYEINRIAAVDDPGNAPGTFPDIDRWREIVLGAPWFRADGQFLAVAEGRYVGLASVGHDRGESTAAALIAGVAPEFRGRGIAQALKARTLAFAKARGASAVATQVHADNGPMLHISRKLGFATVGGVRTFERALGP